MAESVCPKIGRPWLTGTATPTRRVSRHRGPKKCKNNVSCFMQCSLSIGTGLALFFSHITARVRSPERHRAQDTTTKRVSSGNCHKIATNCRWDLYVLHEKTLFLLRHKQGRLGPKDAACVDIGRLLGVKKVTRQPHGTSPAFVRPLVCRATVSPDTAKSADSCVLLRRTLKGACRSLTSSLLTPNPVHHHHHRNCHHHTTTYLHTTATLAPTTF